MRIGFNIKDDAVTEAKVLAFAVSRGYQEQIQGKDGLVPNPETAKDYGERALKKEFLEPWAQQRALSKYNEEYNKLIGD